MDLSKTVACTAVVLIIALAAGHAFAQGAAKPPAGKPPAPAAAKSAASPANPATPAPEPDDELDAQIEQEREAMRKREAEEARRLAAEERVAAEKQRREDLLRRCVIRPVMTDADIDACRVAYRL